MSDDFKAPEGWETYSNSVVEKTRLLIKLDIWDGIDELDLNGWLKNFGASPEGRYFSACILDSFTYRTKKMCSSMLRSILDDIVPDFCREIEINNFSSIAEWKEKLSNADPVVRFVPVSMLDGKVKSSAIVARDFLQANDLPGYIVQDPENIQRTIDNGTKLIVFLDDIAGSGRQFSTFCKQRKLEQYSGLVNFLYVPLAAHSNAIKSIEERNEYVKVKPVDLLGSYQSLFYTCSDGFFRGDQTNSVESAKKFYEEIFKTAGGGANKYRYGKSSLCLTYSFYFSTPNNNIKALYHHSDDGSWQRLVFRAR